MSRKAIAGVLVLISVIAASVAIGQVQQSTRTYSSTTTTTTRSARGTHFGRGGWERLKTELNLTPQQASQIDAIKQSFMTQTTATRDQIKAKTAQMKTLWASDNPDPAAIKSLAHEIHVLRGEMIDPGVDSMIAGYNVLTPTQKAKLRTMIQSHGMMHHGMGLGF